MITNTYQLSSCPPDVGSKPQLYVQSRHHIWQQLSYTLHVPQHYPDKAHDNHPHPPPRYPNHPRVPLVFYHHAARSSPLTRHPPDYPNSHSDYKIMSVPPSQYVVPKPRPPRAPPTTLTLNCCLCAAAACSMAAAGRFGGQTLVLSACG